MVTTSSTICRCTRRGGTGRLRVIGVLLLMLFSLFSASYAQFVIGQARVVSVTPSPESPDDPAGCVRQRLIGQTEYWYIQQDRRYTVRLEGVECDGEQIQVVLYDPGRTPNDPGECYEPICLTAQRVGEGVYEFTYRFPTISEKGYYVRYCTTDCNPATGFVARRSDGVRAPAQLHLAYFTPPGYNPPCEFLIEDKDCTPPGCVKASEDVELPCNPDPDDIPSECDWKRDTYFNEDTCIIGVPECVPDPDTGLPYTEIELPERGPCWRARVFTYRVLKCDGEYCEVSRKFIWQEDREPPVIHNVPDSPINLGCVEEPPNLTCEGIIAQYNIFVTDNCDPSDGQYTQLECEAGEVQQDGCRYSQTFTFWARDKCGNYAERTLTFTWQIDPTPPVLEGVPQDEYLGCFPNAHPTIACETDGQTVTLTIRDGDTVIRQFTITASDDCDPNLQVECLVGELRSVGNCLYAQTVTIRATNKCGLTTEASVTFTWQYDPTPPVIKGVPEDQYIGCFAAGHPEVECTGSVIRIWSGGKLIYEFPLNVFDDCDPNLQVECEVGELQSLGNCRYAQTVTVRATNKCGLTTEDSVTFTWQYDPTPPYLDDVPQDEYLGCFPNAHPTIACETDGQTVTLTIRDGDTVIRQFTITASDDCDPNLQVECEVGELQSLGNCLYAQTVTIRATNKCGLTTEASVTFTWQYDPVPPVVNNVPENHKLPCNTRPSCDLVIALFNIEAKDNCDPNPTLNCEAGPIEQIGPCEFRQSFTFWAVDKCGNRSADYVTVMLWKEDTEPPVLHNVPEGGDLGCNPTDLPECDPNVTATDNCTENVNVICTPSPIITIGCLRLQYFTYTAADECGNAASQTVLYWWTVDTTPPIVRCPDDITVQLQPGDCFAEVVYRAKAHDDCDPTVREAVCNPPSGTFFEIGQHTVTCSATDRCGNTGTCSFTVTVYGYICGLKFEDLNGNGTRDPGEPGVEGWTIILLASDGVTVLQTTQTGPDGSFCFFGLLRGTYFVVEEDRPGWVHTTPRSRQIDLPRDCGKQVVFGNRRTR